MMKIVLSSMFVGSLLLSAYGAESPAVKDWPCWRGGDGSGWMPCTTPLVRDPKQMKLLWESEEKQMSGSYSLIMGGAGGPVIADGKVFFTYMWPGGAFDQGYFDQFGKMPAGRDLQLLEKFANATGMTKEEFIKTKCLQRADDVVIAMDLKTGKTLWKQVFKERNANVSKGARGFFKFNKTGPHIIACAAYGMVVTLGSGGDLYGLDAGTGKILWEKTKFRGAPQKHGICDGGTTYGGGLFIVAKGGGTIVGLDPKTGAERWSAKANLAEHAMPIRWVHAGKEYIVASATCVDPTDGKTLWTASGAAAGDVTPSVQGDSIVFGGAAPLKADDPGGSGLSCYTMTPSGVTKAWALDGAYATINWCTPCIRDGAVYAKVRKGTLGRDRGVFVCVDLASGKILGEILNYSDSCGSMVGIGDRLQYDGMWFDANPKSFAVIGDGPEAQGDVRFTFSSSHTPSPAGGSLIILRGQNSLRCYDLAAK